MSITSSNQVAYWNVFSVTFFSNKFRLVQLQSWKFSLKMATVVRAETCCWKILKVHFNKPPNFFVSNQQSQYSVFHELMCWQSLTFRLSNVMSLLQRGDLLYHVTGRMRDLKPKFYQLPRPWSPWVSSPIREKIPMVEPGIEPGTSWLVDH
jgi:hypothetical protein